MKEEVISNLNSELEHIKELDKISDIKCYDYVKNNYMKKRLFINRSYGSSNFYNFISNEIVKILSPDIKYIKVFHSKFANKMLRPIYYNVHNYLNLEFDFNKRFLLRSNIVEYTIWCKLSGLNYFTSRKEIDKFRINLEKIIIEKKFR